MIDIKTKYCDDGFNLLVSKLNIVTMVLID
jgi:hypothetical protein